MFNLNVDRIKRDGIRARQGAAPMKRQKAPHPASEKENSGNRQKNNNDSLAVQSKSTALSPF